MAALDTEERVPCGRGCHVRPRTSRCGGWAVRPREEQTPGEGRGRPLCVPGCSAGSRAPTPPLLSFSRPRGHGTRRVSERRRSGASAWVPAFPPPGFTVLRVPGRSPMWGQAWVVGRSCFRAVFEGDVWLARHHFLKRRSFSQGLAPRLCQNSGCVSGFAVPARGPRCPAGRLACHVPAAAAPRDSGGGWWRLPLWASVNGSASPGFSGFPRRSRPCRGFSRMALPLQATVRGADILPTQTHRP